MLILVMIGLIASICLLTTKISAWEEVIMYINFWYLVLRCIWSLDYEASPLSEQNPTHASQCNWVRKKQI
jgi:hypothetical protein